MKANLILVIGCALNLGVIGLTYWYVNYGNPVPGDPGAPVVEWPAKPRR
jgi:hypothetical protein